MESILKSVNAVVWGIPVLLLILAAGILLTVNTKFAQFRLFFPALKKFIHSIKGKARGFGAYKALCTALAATVGTGNIAGVAGAIAIGGPGVIFWMWICAILGMVTKFSEVTLALHYRIKDTAGEYVGGPMLMITRGLNRKYHFLAYVYCFFGVVAAFGVGNATQVNAVISALREIPLFTQGGMGKTEALLIGLGIAIFVYFAFSKGSDRIGNLAQILVPVAAVAYILLSAGVLILCRHRLPEALKTIVISAFSPGAVTGGVIGSAWITLRVGASRGVFTNEAGMGTASIAHAAATVDHPVEQGMMGIIEVFLDTVVICTLTALVILCSGVSIPYGLDTGLTLTMEAFSSVYGSWAALPITALVCIFAIATILGWGLYGARCAQFIFGEGAWKVFQIAQCGCILVAVLLETGVVWLFSELVNGLMAIPNLIALLMLQPVLIKMIKDYTANKEAYRPK